MSSDEHDGWRYVIGSNNKSIKGDISKWGNTPKSKKISSPTQKIEKSENDINIANIISSISSMIPILQNSDFYSVIRNKLLSFKSNTFRVVVLGCASPTHGPFITNCKWQWALAKLLTIDTMISLKIASIKVFDPIMTEIDYKIWESLITTPLDGGNIDYTLLLMPHCEAELYQTVLESLYLGLDPIETAQRLSEQLYTPSITRCNVNNVVAIANSLVDCEYINLSNEFKETKLPTFEPCANAFNNIYFAYV